MTIKLNHRPAPEVTFRAILPEWLGPGGECFIEFKAKAAGATNPEYIAAMEDLSFLAQVKTRALTRVEEDEDWVKDNNAAAKEISSGRFEVLYDTCIASWKTNIQDDGHDLEPTRESFLALTDVRNKAVAEALIAFEDRCVKAGVDGEAVIEDAAKN